MPLRSHSCVALSCISVKQLYYITDSSCGIQTIKHCPKSGERFTLPNTKSDSNLSAICRPSRYVFCCDTTCKDSSGCFHRAYRLLIREVCDAPPRLEYSVLLSGTTRTAGVRLRISCVSSASGNRMFCGRSHHAHIYRTVCVRLSCAFHNTVRPSVRGSRESGTAFLEIWAYAHFLSCKIKALTVITMKAVCLFVSHDTIICICDVHYNGF